MRERKYYIDILRIIAIIQVINLHITAPFFDNVDIFKTDIWWCSSIINTLSRISVPIFIMISGALLLGDDGNKKVDFFLKKRFNKVLLPFIFWGMFYYILNNNYSVKGFVIALLENRLEYHLWFMYYIIGLYLIFPLLKIYMENASKSKIIYFVMLCCIPGIISLVNYCFNVDINIILPGVSGCIGLFLLGYLLDQEIIKQKNRIIIYILGIVSLIFTILGTYILSNNLGNPTQILFDNWGINIIIMASSFFIFIKYLCINLKMKNNKINKIIITMSKLSFGIYLVHAYILRLFFEGKIFPEIATRLEGGFLGFTIRFLIIYCISYIIIFIISKIKYLRRLV